MNFPPGSHNNEKEKQYDKSFNQSENTDFSFFGIKDTHNTRYVIITSRTHPTVNTHQTSSTLRRRRFI